MKSKISEYFEKSSPIVTFFIASQENAFLLNETSAKITVINLKKFFRSSNFNR